MVSASLALSCLRDWMGLCLDLSWFYCFRADCSALRRGVGFELLVVRLLHYLFAFISYTAAMRSLLSAVGVVGYGF